MAAFARDTLYTPKEVAEHNTFDDAWVIHDGVVYDVSAFTPEHPGGNEILEDHLGKDITKIMMDMSSHEHSSSAYGLMLPYRIGITDPAKKEGEKKLTGDDMKKAKLIGSLDYSKAMVPQVAKLGKYYWEWCHTPISPDINVRYFPNDFMEWTSTMHWWGVPLCWGPVVTLFMYLALTWGGEAANAVPASVMWQYFAFGVLFWTFTEYTLHRFVFHYEPKSPHMITLHFVMHGAHHLSPMDRMRLVFPVVPATLGGVTPILSLTWLVFSPPHVFAFDAGLLSGYIVYDLCHYYLHHGVPKLGFLKALKTHHLHHHYKQDSTNFGITSKLWDYAFDSNNPESQRDMKKL